MVIDELSRTGASGSTGSGVSVSRLPEIGEADRAETIHLVLKQLRARSEPSRVYACELAWEVHTYGYWSRLRHDDGRPYESEENYFRDVLGLASWRTAYKRLAIGRMLTAFPEGERRAVRAAIAEVGVAKAAIIVPAIERTGQWTDWVKWARELPAPALQAHISAALDSSPRGRTPEPPGESFRRMVLSAMPDIDAMEVVERFFSVGRQMVGSDHPVAIFLAGCRDCLADWEVHLAARRERRWTVTAERDPDDRSQDAPEAAAERCPHGQTVERDPSALPTWANPQASGEEQP